MRHFPSPTNFLLVFVLFVAVRKVPPREALTSPSSVIPTITLFQLHFIAFYATDVICLQLNSIIVLHAILPKFLLSIEEYFLRV